jgi:hypothetical protein
LKGKRVGTTQYGATAIVYIKGMLQDEYGVKPEDMRWFVGGLTKPTEPPLLPLNLPDNIALEFLPRGQTLEAMLADGKLDALFSIYFPQAFLSGSPEIARLFPNHREIEEDNYRRTKILPIMHTVVIKKDVLNAHPFIAASLYRAFCEARDRALTPLYDTDALMVSLPFLIDHIEHSRRVFGADYWAYGLEPNCPRAGPRPAPYHPRRPLRPGGVDLSRRGPLVAPFGRRHAHVLLERAAECGFRLVTDRRSNGGNAVRALQQPGRSDLQAPFLQVLHRGGTDERSEMLGQRRPRHADLLGQLLECPIMRWLRMQQVQRAPDMPVLQSRKPPFALLRERLDVIAHELNEHQLAELRQDAVAARALLFRFHHRKARELLEPAAASGR